MIDKKTTEQTARRSCYAVSSCEYVQMPLWGAVPGGWQFSHGLRGLGHGHHTWEAQLMPTWGSRGHSGRVGPSGHSCQNSYHSH